MLSKRQISLIRSLHQAKFRSQSKLFMAEGDLLVRDLITAGLVPSIIAAEEAWLNQYEASCPQGTNTLQVDSVLMKKISAHRTPSPVLGVFHQPGMKQAVDPLAPGLVLYLDGIRDPGNMGTIIRTAEWFGLAEIVLSPDCADPFNPKAVQASMGSIARVMLRYAEATSFFTEVAADTPVLGALLDGASIYEIQVPPQFVLVIGNEAQGIREVVMSFVQTAIRIPAYPPSDSSQGCESLNAATAAGILMAEIRRKQLNTSSY